MKRHIYYILACFLKRITSLENNIYQNYHKYLLADCGTNVVIDANCEFLHNHVHLGNNVYIGPRAHFIASTSHIYIGNHVVFGPDVTIRGGDHRTDVVGQYMFDIRESIPDDHKDVKINDDVWIGCNVTILKGVSIGEGSIIGAGSVVVKDVPAYTIYVGAPQMKMWPRWDDASIREHKEILRRRLLDASQSTCI